MSQDTFINYLLILMAIVFTVSLAIWAFMVIFEAGYDAGYQSGKRNFKHGLKGDSYVANN